MAAKYTPVEIEEKFSEIERLIIEDEMPVRKALKEVHLSPIVFYGWLSESKYEKRYARACELRADKIFEEIIEISDHSQEDHTPMTGANVVNRDRLKVDARKWVLAKLHPKKYGDKTTTEITGKDGQPLIPVRGFIIEK